MTKLWVTDVEQGDRLRRLIVLREALRFLGDADIQAASEIYTALRRDGVAYVGEADNDDSLAKASDVLESAGFTCALDLPPEALEKLAAKRRVKQMTASGATPEQVFAQEAPGEPDPTPGWVTQQAYDTAIVLVAMCDGSPLKAAGEARLLARATGDEELYLDVVRVLCHVFPTTKQILEASGVVSDDL